MKRRKNKEENRDHQPYTKTTAIIQVIMTIALVVFLAPILIIINYSFKTKKELYLNSPLSLPEKLNFENYVNAFKKLDLATTFSNTFLYTAISVVILALLCGTTAWAIARCKKKFFKFAYIYFVIGILIPYQALFLPIYTIGYKLHLTNTRFGIIFMYVATGVSFGVFLMTSFMSTVPLELEEAARIDGLGRVGIITKILAPMCKSALFTVILVTFTDGWNSYFWPKIIARGEPRRVLTIGLAQLQNTFAGQETMNNHEVMAGAVLAVVPVIILFFIFQKYMLTGYSKAAMK